MASSPQSLSQWETEAITSDVERIKELFHVYKEQHEKSKRDGDMDTEVFLKQTDLRASKSMGVLLENRWGAVAALMDSRLFQTGSSKADDYLNRRSKMPESIREQVQSELSQGPLPLDVLGHTAVTLLAFVKALMTMENEDVETASKLSEACAEYCARYGDDVKTSQRNNEDPLKIIFDAAHAEAQLAGSVLLFLQPSLSQALQGGWALRKSYNQFSDCLDRANVDEALIRKCGGQPISQEIVERFLSARESSATSPDDDEIGAFISLLHPDDETRLETKVPRPVLSAILFGMGSFQLVLSMLPPTLQKVVSFFGFRGDRTFGLACLRTSFLAGGLHAPLSLFSLLSYLIGTSLWLPHPPSELLDESKCLLDIGLHTYPSSVLLRWLNARWFRACRHPVNGLAEVETAFRKQSLPLNDETATSLADLSNLPDSSAVGWKGMKSICLYEIAWMLCLHVELGKEQEVFYQAAQYFYRLRLLSMWSISFYCYLAGSCFLSAGRISDAMKLLEEVEGNIQQKSGRVPPVEQLGRRRARRILCSLKYKELGDVVTFDAQNSMLHHMHFTCFSPMLELLYLWNCFAQSEPLCRFAAEYTERWLNTYDNQSEDELFTPDDLKRTGGSNGFLGFGKKSCHSNSDEDLGLCLVIRASALHFEGNTTLGMATIERLEEEMESGKIVPKFEGCYVEPAAHFEKALMLLTQEKTDLALDSLAKVHKTSNDVDFGNRFSFKARQVENEIAQNLSG